MTLDLQPAETPDDKADPERPTDPRPAWERIAYTWLAREVDQCQPVDPATLAREVSVAPGLAHDLVRVLIAAASLRRELAGDSWLAPAELAAQVGTTAAVARQWLTALRAQHPSAQDLEVLREPVSHGRPTTGQLAG